MRRGIILFALLFTLTACHTGAIPYPAVPPVSVTPTPAPEGVDYTQKPSAERFLKKRIAVARFDDNLPVAESPFGHKEQVDVVGPGIHVHQENLAVESK